MRNLEIFVKRIKRWTPERRYEEKLAIQAKKRLLEVSRRDIQSKIDALAIELDALYTIDAGHDIPSISNYKDRVHVSDHAVVRYIDRVLNVDTEEFRKSFFDIMPDKVPRNASTITHNGMIFQLVWLTDQIVVKTFYRAKKRKKNAPVS